MKDYLIYIIAFSCLIGVTAALLVVLPNPTIQPSITEVSSHTEYVLQWHGESSMLTVQSQDSNSTIFVHDGESFNVSQNSTIYCNNKIMMQLP